MTPDSAIKLVSELLDLPLFDSEGNYCGCVDDVELAGGPGKDLTLKALLIGPGAYQGRLPKWAMALVKLIAGDRLTRVPMERVKGIRAEVQLDRPGRDLGLDRSEKKARKWLPEAGAL